MHGFVLDVFLVRARTRSDQVSQSGPLVRKLSRTASIIDRQCRSSNSHRVRRKQSFNPQPTARESPFYTHIVLSNATIRTDLDLSSIKAESIKAEKGSRHRCLQSSTITSTSTSTSTTKSDARSERKGSLTSSGCWGGIPIWDYALAANHWLRWDKPIGGRD